MQKTLISLGQHPLKSRILPSAFLIRNETSHKFTPCIAPPRLFSLKWVRSQERCDP